MKITTKQLALSLYESLDGKTPSRVKVALEKFVELLAETNQLTKADKIVTEFIKIWHTKHGIVEALATSANGLNKTETKLLKDYVAGLSGAKEVLLSEKNDKNILGGVIIKYGDKILDGSIRTSLSELKNQLIK
ncbi:ATP synthase F1 subunit delta [Candidatus Falkowbacteria bacterium RIFCSPHIGHO2_02_FULL_42_9]|uniref:ATP synthase subunit delta n=1 Tax=Candidatus Falkowbacteria bacterium RIFCSPHIGHO2_02_FULL_42_9 TaxID=1797986 RepID=A0A1F5S9Q5_9BACT|nr:MAG: ATP synthase F1 subunit delta [Candidatus Falkowbacteria bacterium RIFCSPHIGHO2_02_FULL_42_9]